MGCVSREREGEINRGRDKYEEKRKGNNGRMRFTFLSPSDRFFGFSVVLFFPSLPLKRPSLFRGVVV